jgi:hypothetical protein
MMWTAYLRKKLRMPDLTLSMRDVCHLNTLQKIARDAHREKEDNLVDICGWTLNAEVVSED